MVGFCGRILLIMNKQLRLRRPARLAAAQVAASPWFFLWIGQLVFLAAYGVITFLFTPPYSDTLIFRGIFKLGFSSFAIGPAYFLLFKLAVAIIFNLVLFLIILVLARRYAKWIFVYGMLVLLTINIFVLLYW